VSKKEREEEAEYRTFLETMREKRNVSVHKPSKEDVDSIKRRYEETVQVIENLFQTDNIASVEERIDLETVDQLKRFKSNF
jgi:hypothetical protein